MAHSRFVLLCVVCLGFISLRTLLPASPPVSTAVSTVSTADPVRELQAEAMEAKQADWGYWGPNPARYSGWTSHSNRLIPVYTFGIDLSSVRGEHSPYRSAQRIEELYDALPADTHNPEADYFDQTDVYRLQKAAIAAGKKRIILVVFDGMDWQTTQAAAIYKAGAVKYHEGRGTGLHFQDYCGAPTDFGYFVTSPHNDGTKIDVNAQTVTNPGGKTRGGYDWKRGGATPWAIPTDPYYLIARNKEQRHAYTDSSASATSMTAGIKTYNDAVNVDHQGKQVETIAHQRQRDGFAIGVVSNVPISHATPSAAYAHNVHRDDYQDLTRDLLGLRSIAHKYEPLPGVDVLIGCGWGEEKAKDKEQGENFVPGNRYLTDGDRKRIDARHGVQYVVAERTPNVAGRDVLTAGVQEAIAQNLRLFGFFGYAKNAHLPFRTADGKNDPTMGAKYQLDEYTPEDVYENPTLAEMAVAALDVLSQNPKGFWLMIEAGDVDWANHDNNIDCSIGAMLDGDDAIHAVTDWIEKHGGWDDTVLIITADHGHYFNLVKPEVLAEARRGQRVQGSGFRVQDGRVSE